MALPLSNTADSGTDETALTTGNSGGSNGNAFDVVTNTGGGAGWVFDADQRRWGPGSYRLDFGTAVGNAWLRWSTSLGTPTTVLARSYFRIGTLPSSNLLIRQYQGSAANRGLIRVQSSGVPQILNAASTAVHTFGTALPTGKWIRMDEKWVFNAATGTAQVAFYWDSDSSHTCDSLTAVMDSGTLTSLALGGSTADTANLGASAGTGQSGNASWWFDDLTLIGAGSVPVGPPTEWWAATGSGMQPLRAAYQGDAA